MALMKMNKKMQERVSNTIGPFYKAKYGTPNIIGNNGMLDKTDCKVPFIPA